MSNSENVSQAIPSYPMDAENIAEMARLVRQAHMLSEHLGLLPPDYELTGAKTILDIGCGPGAWALEMARRFPHCQVIGIDISERMIGYASFTAREQQLQNIQFQVMDARQSLAFADATFDIIHARFISGLLSRSTLPGFLQECIRLLRADGMLWMLEVEHMGSTNSPSLLAYNRLLIEAMRKTGQTYTPSGDAVGLASTLPRLLRDLNFEQIQQYAHVIDYSAGMPAHTPMYDNFRTLFKLMQPFLTRTGVAAQEELDVLLARTEAEMNEDDFCGAAFIHRLAAIRPSI